ncbi:MAG: hypothetical protein RLZZ450_2600 [Pseudomonadota bacterium]|jgi:hypothetical protein
MSRFDVERAAVVLLLALSVASCSDDDSKGAKPPDSGWPGDWPDANDAGHDAGADAARPGDIDASGDAAVVDATVPDAAAPLARTSCLDRPGALPAAPTGPLPCELLPPGLTL